MNTNTGTNQKIDEFLGEPEAPRWRRTAKYWIPAAFLLLVALVVWRVSGDDENPDYLTEEVTRQSLEIDVTATGNLRPTNQVEIGSEVSGKIDAIFVDVNDRVVRGQVLARINTDVIENDITRSRANLNSALANVERARATLEYDQAQLDRLRQVYELSDGKVPSKSELEVAEANVTRDKAALAAEQANVVSARASLSSAETQRSRAIIRSPVAGVVLARQVEPGQTVAASFNTPTLFVIAEDLSQMQLRVSIDEADVGNVRQGQEANFTVDAYPGRAFPAVVERVDLASNNTTTQEQAAANAVVVYEARLSVANSDGLLRPGMTATANIATESTGEQMLVPNAALRFRPPIEDDRGGVQLNNGNDFGLEREGPQATIGVGSRQTVYVLQDDGSIEPVSVTTGRSDGRLTVVQSGDLKVGMKVVTSIKAPGVEED
ncbi:MAG TPA: efflux RND transporter periplasmic adaptor subunit [Sphingomonadaceae bacterium]|nr:efflux RND transporter periplasmic adaptor subunit [Sphingomonadaceae bacterium]